MDIIARHRTNQYTNESLTVRFEAISDKGMEYIRNHWSISGNEPINPVAAAMWVRDMESNGLTVDLRTSC